MPFVKFTGNGRSFAPKVSINKIGVISLNEGSVERFKIRSYKFGVFYFDIEKSRIGIQLTNKTEEGAILIRFRRTGGASFGAKSFLEYFSIRPGETHLYNLSQGEREEFLVIDLGISRIRGRTNP